MAGRVENWRGSPQDARRIQGPFGAGKTVLQNLVSRYSAVDIVIVRDMIALLKRGDSAHQTGPDYPKYVKEIDALAGSAA